MGTRWNDLSPAERDRRAAEDDAAYEAERAERAANVPHCRTPGCGSIIDPLYGPLCESCAEGFRPEPKETA